MRNIAAAVLILSASVGAAVAQPRADPEIKEVRLLATGGTIAGKSQGTGPNYRAGVVPIGDILRTAPGLDEIAKVSAEQVANVGSYDMDETLWLKLLGRVQAAFSQPEVAGVVITHGTDTLEETAYFLSLVLPATKPVVLVGSMRPGTAVSADGPQNLMDAVRVASADQARNHGVLVVMNDTILDPASATKVDVRHVNAFAAPSRGAVGEVLTAHPNFFAKGRPEPAAFAIIGDRLPRVTIAYAYAGLTGDDIRAAAKGAKGLVIAGVGAGGFSASARDEVQKLTSEGIPVVRTARQGIGDVWRGDAGDLSDAALGTLAGRELTPAKARILLMLALQTRRSREELQSLFDKFGTLRHD